ncbi:zinc dependent phospholipase C family protein [Alkaliphilus transvaalensis]|uniref:zinc dependent phospholipase C family protein n=1 Tax=Alkaliphilus transvaalensis TaxID=114628 RepID=UPI00047DF2E8|nr:zinc dependent phospholipase C family protein [Alkaliphilus transvaalensis]
MFPQTHKIISEYLHENISKNFGIELNRKSLIYGSIKPDIVPSLAKLDHFKPQTFNLILDEVHRLSNYQLNPNHESLKDFSTQIGVVTHFIADYFCLPHNDRVKYRKATIVSHLIYENNLHKLFKEYHGQFKDIVIPKKTFNVPNYASHLIKGVVDELHTEYSLREESLMKDLTSSLQATLAVTSYIIYHVLRGGIEKQVA